MKPEFVDLFNTVCPILITQADGKVKLSYTELSKIVIASTIAGITATFFALNVIYDRLKTFDSVVNDVKKISIIEKDVSVLHDLAKDVDFLRKESSECQQSINEIRRDLYAPRAKARSESAGAQAAG